MGGLPTRFEDQTRLPMGVSVNSTSYSAKLLQARRTATPAAVGRPANLGLCLIGFQHHTVQRVAMQQGKQHGHCSCVAAAQSTSP